MNKLSIVIPVTNQEHLTDKSVARLIEYATTDIEIIIVDNGSKVAYNNPGATILRNNLNIGVFPALLQGLAATSNDIVLTMHNDVLLQERGYDARILNEFAIDPKLGIAGFFGGRGVGYDGGRSHPESNMQGIEWGQHGSIHGHVQTHKHPAVVFDSLALILRKSIFYKVFPPEDLAIIAPHHWFDRIVTLGIVTAGYHALTIGVAFDHYGGGTSVANPEFEAFTARWVKEKGMEVVNNPDYTMYMYGARDFRRRWMSKFPFFVDENYNLTYTKPKDDYSDY
jgi:glycosyltransferase involved in cell wall biosynthesis